MIFTLKYWKANTAFEDSSKKGKNGRESPITSVKARPLPITPRNLESFSTATTSSKLTILDNAKRSLLLKPQPPIKSGRFGDDDDVFKNFIIQELTIN